MPARNHLVLVLVVALLPLACRTYGGYGSEEAALQQIEAAYETFERDLAQARNDVRLVSAEANQAGDGIAQALQATVAAHEEMLARHGAFVEEAREHPNAYRHLSRTLRGMVSEQQMVYRQYQALLHAASAARDTTAQFRSGSVIPRPHVVPPYYERIQNASQLSAVGGLSRAMSARPGGAAADTLGGASGQTAASAADTAVAE